jgi:hypothetical protein
VTIQPEKGYSRGTALRAPVAWGYDLSSALSGEHRQAEIRISFTPGRVGHILTGPSSLKYVRKRINFK